MLSKKSFFDEPAWDDFFFKKKTVIKIYTKKFHLVSMLKIFLFYLSYKSRKNFCAEICHNLKVKSFFDHYKFANVIHDKIKSQEKCPLKSSFFSQISNSFVNM